VKRISPGTVTIVVLAIICGLVGAYAIKQMNKPPVVQKKQAPPKPEGTPIVVVKSNVEKHSRLRMSDLEVIMVPHGQDVPEEILRKPQIAVDRVVLINLQAGQALHKNNLLGIGERLPGLAERIPAGMRALTVNIDRAGIANTQLEDNARVDIAMTVKGDHPDLGELATRTLLRSIQVLDLSSNNSGPMTLTVAVTPKDANKLINAEQTGDLSVTLVSHKDAATATSEVDDSITRRELLGLSEEPQPEQPYTIQKWEGSTLRTIQFSKSADDSNSEVVRTPATPVQNTSVNKLKITPKVGGPEL